MEASDLQDPGRDPGLPPLAPAPPPRPFRAGKAFLAFLVYLAAQFLFAVAASVVVVVFSPGSDRGARKEHLLHAAVFGAGIGSAVGVLWATKRWARDLARDRSPSGLGLVRPPGRTLFLSALAGGAVAAAYIAILLFRGGDSSNSSTGPLAKMASQPGTGRILWALFAVLIAPPSEELLFRGLMLKGMAASWGVRTASILTTLIFVALHLPETGSSPLATGVISALALSTLAARLLTGSLYSSIALHVAYNGVLVLMVYAVLGV